MRLLAHAAALAVLAPAAASAQPTRADLNAPLSALLADTTRHVAQGGRGAEDDRAILATTLAARIARSGAAVAVIDRTPPFLKIYDRRGMLLGSAFPRGGGPGESFGLGALAVVDDTLLLVSHVAGGRLALVDLRGKVVWERRLQQLAIFSLVQGCGRQIVVYGRRLGERVGAWLFTVTPRGETFDVAQVYADEIEPASIAFGRTYGLVRTAAGVEARHAFGESTSVLRHACGAPRATAVPVAGTATYPARPLPNAKGQQMTLSIREGMMIPNGVASLGDLTVLTDAVVVGQGKEERTIVHVHGPRGTTAAAVRGRYKILDSRPGVGVLFATDEPEPHVFLVPEAALRRALGG